MAYQEQFLQQREGYDAGLRGYMLGIYNYMSCGLVLTGIVAFLSAHSAAVINALYTTGGNGVVAMKPLAWIVMFAPLGVVIFLSARLRTMSLAAAQIGYWVYAIVMGLSLSTIFLIFTGETITRALFVAAATFGLMSFYGYTAKRDFTGLGAFLMMGLWGLIIASVVNLFLKSSGLQFALSMIGVAVFVGLTAFDTQKLKRLYYQLQAQGEWRGKIVIFGALTLYLDFINLFLQLLYLSGRQRK